MPAGSSTGRRGRVATDIDLHDLFAIARPAVAQADGQLHGGTCLDVFGREFRLTIIECRIAQSVAEREKRFAAEIAIGTSLHPVILEVGQLCLILVECYGQASCRVVITEQHVGYGRAARLPGVPCL